MNKGIKFLCATFCIALIACSTPTGLQSDREISSTSNHTVIVVQDPLSLADILVQVPGVMISRDIEQTFVTIRGGAPLYLIDGIRIGNSYQEVVDMLNIFDIESVEVIKGISETAIYGPGSGHGVVLINTRGQSEIEGE
jgi:TonB-dependent SusC/RagA subfamily outer membrane receptor